MSSGRKLQDTDLPLVQAALNDLVSKLKRADTKAIYKHLDVRVALGVLADHPHAYIVGGYLVVYMIGTPWFVSPSMKVLSEQLVLQLAVSGDFTVVPAFLERSAREAGCQLVMAGTALAKSDRALASLYSNNGFKAEGTTLTKDI